MIHIANISEIPDMPIKIYKDDLNMTFAGFFELWGGGIMLSLVLVKRSCLSNIEDNLDDSLLAVILLPINKPLQSCKIAALILKGSLFYEEGKSMEALTSFKQAIAEEDQLVYREPQDWVIPVRQYLGVYLLKMNKAADALKIYKEDLISNPENGWSLLGMYNSLVAQHRNSEAAKFKKRYVTAFKSADVHPVASVF